MEHGVLFAAIGALSDLKRDLATGFGVLFAGMGVLHRRAGAMSTSIIILFLVQLGSAELGHQK